MKISKQELKKVAQVFCNKIGAVYNAFAILFITSKKGEK